MRRLTALKVKVGDKIHLKNPFQARSYIVTEIDHGPGSDPHVKYPLFRTKDGEWYSYLLVRIVQNEKGGIVV